LPPIFISTILQSGKFLNLAHYFPYDVKLRLLPHSRSFLANQKAGNAIVGAQNLLNERLEASALSLSNFKKFGMIIGIITARFCKITIPFIATNILHNCYPEAKFRR